MRGGGRSEHQSSESTALCFLYDSYFVESFTPLGCIYFTSSRLTGAMHCWPVWVSTAAPTLHKRETAGYAKVDGPDLCYMGRNTFPGLLGFIQTSQGDVFILLADEEVCCFRMAGSRYHGNP